MSKGKKKGQEEIDITTLLGRPGNHVKMGILGMPNVGKSATFNVLSELNVPSENFPFCTIDPNIAKVTVPDERFDWLCENFKPKSEIHAALAITDIAGLVKGAAEGAGLGNEFLSHVNAVDGLYHVVRAFKGKEIEHVEGNLDAIRDLEIILQELRLKDLANLANTKTEIEKRLRVGKNTKTTWYWGEMDPVLRLRARATFEE
jgi:obg-like ATPase 1